MELVLVPLVAFLFHEPFFERPLLVALVMILGTVGFASVGTLLAAMLLRSRTRDALLPILLYPITVPVIIASVLGTSALLATPPAAALATFWIWILVSFDVVFLTLALWMFEPLMTE
jgi:heme exporter protein B